VSVDLGAGAEGEDSSGSCRGADEELGSEDETSGREIS
jgi:hypothetical protein